MIRAGHVVTDNQSMLGETFMVENVPSLVKECRVCLWIFKYFVIVLIYDKENQTGKTQQ